MIVDQFHLPTHTTVISEQAHVCPRCRSMHFVFVNAGGMTRCVGCASPPAPAIPVMRSCV